MNIALTPNLTVKRDGREAARPLPQRSVYGTADVMARAGKGQAGRQITLEAQLSLAHSAWEWATTAVLLRRPRSTTHDQWDFSQLVIIQTVDSIEWERYTRGLHMLCLALRHLDRCLELLASSPLPPDFPHQSCHAFRRAWCPLSDLRNVMEHEEDYIAGGGNKPLLVVHHVHGWINIRGVQVPTRPHQEIRNTDGLLTGYRVQGRHYDLTEVLRYAEELARALREFVFPPKEKSNDTGGPQVQSVD